MRDEGWVACDYTHGDSLEAVQHGELYETVEEAAAEAAECGYEGVRYIHTDGHLYVDRPDDDETEDH